jgi:hypothetical protein
MGAFLGIIPLGVPVALSPFTIQKATFILDDMCYNNLNYYY